MIHSYEAWGDTEDILFLIEAHNFENFNDLLGVELAAAQNNGDWFDAVLSYLWEFRRLMWIELVPLGRIRVKFMHHGETGAGIWPQTLLRSRSQSALDNDLTAWPDEDSFVLQPDWFDRSDQLYMECILDGKLFGWPELSLENIALLEHESELFEHSFSSADIITVSKSADKPGWAKIGSAGQAALIEQLRELVMSQVQEFEGVLVDPRDLLALVAAHPDTHPDVMHLDIFQGQEAISALAL